MPDTVQVSREKVVRLIPPEDADDLSPLAASALMRGHSADPAQHNLLFMHFVRQNNTFVSNEVSVLTKDHKGEYLQIAELLLRHGADHRLRDAFGSMVSHIAASQEDIDMLTLLSKHGADFSACDASGHSVREIAGMGIQVNNLINVR